jgi:uncharacterized protein YjcR
MARYNDTVDTTPNAIRAFAENLRNVATGFDQQAEFAEKLGLSSVSVKNWKSAKKSVNAFAAFAAAIQDAIVKSKVTSGFDEMIAPVEPEKPLKNKVKRTNNPS